MTRLFLSFVCVVQSALAQADRTRGSVTFEVTRPRTFPHRIWAACDFEAQTPDYAWFGPKQSDDIPNYPGNKTALGVSARPYRNFAGIMTGINPVPGPRMGKVKHQVIPRETEINIQRKPSGDRPCDQYSPFY